MKKISIKVKITIWITLMIGAVYVILLAFMVSVSNSVAHQTAVSQLTEIVRSNASEIDVSGSTPKFGAGFSFYKNGVTTLVYSKKESLLAGQLPVSFSASESFQNGEIRIVPSENTSYLVLDVWISKDWDSGYWMRGLMESPENGPTVRNLLIVALLALPLFLFLTAFGGYRILRRAFRPLNNITGTAEAINEARDLSLRIGLPPGKDEFSRLAAVFDALFERLEKSFEAEKQFTSDASHELRTPVSIIKGACEYAEKYEETPKERQETIAMIHRQANKMSGLISQLLNMTRLDQRTENILLEIVDLGELIRELCRERGYDMQGVALELQKGVTVEGDAVLLTRLAENLIDNALKYGRCDGPCEMPAVKVSVFQEQGEVLLQVRDFGPGIPAEHQDKIWQRFYQVEASRSEETGVGLGLAMVSQIAQLHGGTVTLESKEGQGSCFTLHLPFVGK